MAGTLSGAIFWQEGRDGDGCINNFSPNLLPLNSDTVGGCTDVQLCTKTNHCLVTFRPSKSHPLHTVLLALFFIL